MKQLLSQKTNVKQQWVRTILHLSLSHISSFCWSTSNTGQKYTEKKIKMLQWIHFATRKIFTYVLVFICILLRIMKVTEILVFYDFQCISQKQIPHWGTWRNQRKQKNPWNSVAMDIIYLFGLYISIFTF